ncbi:unnamed protein product [Coccothraustes coccothraustes]
MAPGGLPCRLLPLAGNPGAGVLFYLRAPPRSAAARAGAAGGLWRRGSAAHAVVRELEQSVGLARRGSCPARETRLGGNVPCTCVPAPAVAASRDSHGVHAACVCRLQQNTP